MKKLFTLLAFILCITDLRATNLMQDQIEHVVVLMLENRSFDNVLGWLYSDEDPPKAFIPNTADPHYLGLSDQSLDEYTNVLVDSSNNVVFSSPPIKGIPSVTATGYLNSPAYDPHETFDYVTEQIYGNNGPMTGFLQNYASLWYEGQWQQDRALLTACLETYTQNEMPVLYNLARHYAVSDNWFCSVPTQTNPNRAFAACGTSEGQVVNGFLGKSQFSSDTIWNRLPSDSWMIFWQADMLPVIYPGPYTGPNNFTSMESIPDLESHYQKIDGFHELARSGNLPAFSFIEPQLTNLVDLSSALVGTQGNDMHPPADIRTAENLIANIYTSLISNPEAWSKTLFVITFDEHGGLFDHVLPPAAVAPDSNNQNGFSFDRYGVRVPAIFISPLIEEGAVVRSNLAAVPFDHTSLISTILTWQKVDQADWNLGARALIAPTFDSCVQLTSPRDDAIINPDQATLPSGAPLSFGDSFYLQDSDSEYIVKGTFFTSVARVGAEDDKMALTFAGGVGPVTHGSFVLIQPQGSSLFMESSLLDTSCFYEENSHASGQWWTIKSVDRPYLGAPIMPGDRVYLENHIYLDLCQFVPARLCKGGGIFGDLVMTTSITNSKSDDLYWVISHS